MSVEPKDERAVGRLAAGDPVRVIATVAVVVQHVAHVSFHYPGRVTEAEWVFATAVVGITKWAVPVFVLLSGALLLEVRPSETLQDFYRRRFTRVGVPLLFWTVFYLCLKAISYRSDDRLSTLPGLLVEGRVYYHLFFMYVIAGLYLFTPMFRRLAADATREEFRLAVWLSLGIAALLPMLGSGPNTALTLFLPYVGYFLAGWWIRQGFVGPQPMRWSWALCLGAIAFLITASVAFHDPRGLMTRYLHGYQSLPIIVMSLSIFVIMLEPGRFGSPTGPFSRACMRLAPLTLGIYLIHPAVLKAMSKLGMGGAAGRVELTIPLVSALAFAISAVATAAMRRSRRLSLLVGG